MQIPGTGDGRGDGPHGHSGNCKLLKGRTEMETPLVENSITECVRIRERQERRARNFQNIRAGRVPPANTAEERFLEFRLSSEHPSRVCPRLGESPALGKLGG